jgi:hypothetical protein
MEERVRRLDEIRLIKEDMPNPWTRYIGRADFNTTDSDPLWQIMRITREGTIWTTTYANKGSFNAKWSLRTTYFPALAVSYAAYQQAMSANFNSDTMVNTGGGLSIQASWTGTNAATATLQVETSVDGVCWCEYPNGDFTIPLTAGCQPFDLPSSSSPFFRVVYTKNTNTTGTLDIAYAAGIGNKPWAVK